MTSTGKAEAVSAEQTAYRFCVVFTLRCQHRQVSAGANMRPPRHIFQNHPGQNGESRHLEPWEFKPQLCWYPKTQHWFDDLLIH